MKLLLVCLCAAGCGGAGGGGGDDINPLTDAQASSDATNQSGLLVDWMASPALPGPIQTDLTVTSATFQINRLQAIGDNGQPTTQSAFELAWKTDVHDPATVGLPTAATGLYAQVSIDLAAPVLGNSFEIVGTTVVAGVTKQYKIHDRNNLDIDVKNYNVALAPGGTETLPITLDLTAALSAVQFNQLQSDDGYLELESGSQMTTFRANLQQAFRKGP